MNDQPGTDRIRDNAAAAAGRRVVAAAAAGDIEALASVYAEGYSERIGGPEGKETTRDEVVASLGGLLRLPGFTLRIDPIATLGSFLDLHRTTISAPPPAPGAAALNAVMVSVGEVNDQGLLVHLDAFAEEQLPQAIERLHERYAETLPPGPERDSALARLDEIRRSSR